MLLEIVKTALEHIVGPPLWIAIDHMRSFMEGSATPDKVNTCFADQSYTPTSKCRRGI